MFSNRGKPRVRRTKDSSPTALEIGMAGEKLQMMRCSEHREAPVVTVSQDSFSVSTCCEDFKKRVLEILSELIRKPPA